MGSLKERIAFFMADVMKRGPLTQRALAGLLDISQGRLSTYLSQKELPRIDVIIKLAEIGGISVDDLVKGEKEPQFLEGAFAGMKIEAPVRSSVVMGPGSTQSGTINISNNINPRITHRREYQPKEGDITAEQARTLKDLVDKVVEREQLAKKRPSTYAAVWNSLNRRMGVTYYREIRLEHFELAEAFLRAWLGRLGRLSWPDKDVWRKERYKAIFAKAKAVGYSKDQVDNLIFERFEKSTIRDLTKKELDRFYDFIMKL
jgi:transcriptional regulator with XRE-family HTH domain